MVRRGAASLVILALVAPPSARADAPQTVLAPIMAPASEPLLTGAESEELRALRLAEQEIFGLLIEGVQPLASGEMPLALTSDVPPLPPPRALGDRDVGVLQGLALPDLPVRWDSRVVDYLRFFKEDARGRSIMASWLRRLPRHERSVREVLRAASLPEDLLYVAMVESGFDPTARSGVGALGMWQFVQGTGEEYGLRRDHWIDERMSPEAATGAAARYLGDLHQRLGSWELALAAYNMGYGALLRAIRKYNTNDFWTLASLEAGLPFETTLYVAKIMACAVVGRNPSRFGFTMSTGEAEAPLTAVEVPGGVQLSTLARAADVAPADLARMNPELRRGRTPPGAASFRLRIPATRADAFVRQLTRIRGARATERAYVVRFGETLEDVAARFRTTTAALTRANELEDGRVRVGFTLMVPDVAPREPAASEPPVVAVPDQRFVYTGRRRIFYRVVEGDAAVEIARFFGVTVDELRRWNGVDPTATLQRGMFLQLFVPTSRDLSRAIVLSDRDVRVLVVGSEEFFDYHEAQRGRVRVRYRVRPGDTVASISRRFDLSPGSLSRINRFDRAVALRPDQEIIVYAPRSPDGTAAPIEDDTASAEVAPATIAPPETSVSTPTAPASSDPAPTPTSPAGAPVAAPAAPGPSAPPSAPAPGATQPGATTPGAAPPAPVAPGSEIPANPQ
jgi:membrane-bound lytic murein transglycosylase D